MSKDHLAEPYQEVDEPSVEKKSSPKLISRREALRRLLIAGGILAEELQFGLLGRVFSVVERTARQANIIENGNISQFMLRLQELINACFQSQNNPEKLHDNLTLLGAWVKLNVAIHYAWHSHKEIAAMLAFNFLYGEGEDLDISKTFETSVSQLIDELFSPEEKAELGITINSTNSELIAILFEEMLAAETVSSGVSHLVWTDGENVDEGIYLSREGQEVYFSGTPSNQLLSERVNAFVVANLRTFSTFYGLAQFRADINGRVVSASAEGIVVEDPTLNLFDVYDWQKGTGFDVSIQVRDALRELNLEAYFANPLFEGILESNVGIFDEDMALLAERGFAQNFNVVASFIPSRNIIIANNRLVAPPLNYIQERNAEVVQLN